MATTPTAGPLNSSAVGGLYTVTVKELVTELMGLSAVTVTVLLPSAVQASET